MRNVFALGACAMLAISLVVPAFAEQPAMPAEPLKMALTKKPVMFDHTQHKDLQCGACHHQVNGKETYQKCATAGCHDLLGQKEKSVNSYFRIAHERKVTNIQSCMSCHLEVAAAKPDKKKELTSCVGSSCHPKS